MKALKNTLFTFFALSIITFGTACSDQRASIYADIPSQGDGVIAVDIEDNDEIEEEIIEEPDQQKLNILSETEKRLINDLHNGEKDKLSFIVVDAENSLLMRSYLADEPRRLASVSKIPTALAALEEVNNVGVSKVASMLKSSNNGEASRYVRLSAKAIDGFITQGSSYSQSSSCPSAFRNDTPATKIVQEWIFSQLPETDWESASLNDGAGCHYGNFMTSLQMAKLIEWADSRGKAYGGKSFEQLLSISGVDGTWRSRNREHRGAIFAKTGTLRPNSNLAGYFYAKRDGEMKKYYFTVFVEKKGGGSHTTRARRMIESLLRYWINYYSQNEGEPLGDF